MNCTGDCERAMDHNFTIEHIDEEDELIHVSDNWEDSDEYIFVSFEKCYIPILVVIGLIFNIVALVILFRRSLWREHEAYIFLATILVKNIVQLGAIYVPWWLALVRDSYDVSHASDVACKFLILLARMLQSSGWFHVAMLCNVFVRLRLGTPGRRSSCAGICQTWCTFHGALVSVALLLTASVVVNIWYFVNASVQSYGTGSLCHAGSIDGSDGFIKLTLNCFVNYLPVIILTPVLWLAIVLSPKRQSGFSFSRMDGTSTSRVDAEELRKVALWLAVVLFVLRAPFHLMRMLFESHLFYNYRGLFSVYTFFLAYPVVVAVVCFAALTGFQEEVKSMAIKCWSCCAIARPRRIALPIIPNSESTSVLQLDTILDTDEDDTQLRA